MNEYSQEIADISVARVVSYQPLQAPKTDANKQKVIYSSSSLTDTQALTLSGQFYYIDATTEFSNLTDEQKAQVKAFAVVREQDLLTNTYQLVIGANVDETFTMKIVFSNYNNETAITNRKQIDKYL